MSQGDVFTAVRSGRGSSLGGVIGASGILTFGAHYLGQIGPARAPLALIFAELANFQICPKRLAAPLRSLIIAFPFGYMLAGRH